MKKLVSVFLLIFIAFTPCTAANYAGVFNGTTSNVNLGTTVGSTGLRSIEFWFKPGVNMGPSTSASGWSFINRNDGTQLHEYGVYIRGTDWNSVGNLGYLYFFVRYNGTLHEIYSNQNTWNAGTWYHVAGVIDPSSGMKLYVNGVLQTMTDPAATQPVQVDNTNSSAIGSWANLRHYQGEMEELRFWTRAITPTEIQNKMCQNLIPANETGLAGYWKFDEGSGTTLVDQTSNTYNGTIASMTWIGDSPCLAPSGNYVMHFDGAGDYVDEGIAAGNQGIRSIEFWFKPDINMSPSTSATGWAFVNRNDATQLHEYEVYIRGTDWNSVGNLGYLYFGVRYNGVIHEIHSNQNTWNAGTWYHIACVIDPATGMALYVNGIQQTMTDPSATMPVEIDNANTTTIGAWANLRYYQGEMDELRYWNRSISAVEINAKMCINLNAANENGLVDYWKFNEGSGTIAYDSTAIPENGTVYNATWVQDPNCLNTGIEIVHPDQQNILVYPNPFHSEFTIKTGQAGSRIEIYSSNGQLISLQASAAELTVINMGDAAGGIYFIRVLDTDNGIIYQEKIIKTE
jgi:hypothetical protein